MSKSHEEMAAAKEAKPVAEAKAKAAEAPRVIKQDTHKTTKAFLCNVPGEDFPTIEVHAVDEPEAKRLYSFAFGAVQMDTSRYSIKVESATPPAA